MKKEIQPVVDYKLLYDLALIFEPSLDMEKNSSRFLNYIQKNLDLPLAAIWRKKEPTFQLMASTTSASELPMIESRLSLIEASLNANSPLLFNGKNKKEIHPIPDAVFFQLKNFGILYLQITNEFNQQQIEYWKSFIPLIDKLSVALIGEMQSPIEDHPPYSKQAYEELLKREFYLSQTLDLSQIGTFEYDPLKKLLRWSKESYQIFGLDPSVGDLSYEQYAEYFVHDDIQDEMRERIENAIKHGTGFDIECRLKRKNDEVFYANVKLVAKSKNGVVSLLYGSVQDITERYRYIKSLRISEKKLIEAQALAKIGSYDYDLEKNKIVWSPETYKIFGMDPNLEEPSYEEYKETLVHPEDREAFYKKVDQCLVEGNPFEIESRQVRTDGSIIHTINIGKILKKNNKIFKVVGTTQDITERKLAEKKILESNQKYTQLFDNLYDAIVVTDKEGRMIDANKSAQKMLGYPKDELKNLLIPDIVHPDDMERSQKYLKKLISDGYYSDYQGRIFRKDGQIVYLQVNSNAIYENGVFAGSRDIVRDITELKKAEQKREELLEELEQVNQELRDFAYVVSHDLKAPLRAISSLSQWLYEDNQGQLSPEGNQQLKLLINRSNRMHSFIEAILEYSRIGRIQLQNEWVDLCALIEGIQEMVAPPANIQFQIPVKLPRFFGQKTRLIQLFQNLITNAINYNDKEQGEIRIEWKDLGSHLQFLVSDNGPGIDPKYHDKVFKIFQTLQSRDKIESTGIGLTIVKRIVQLYEGEIEVHSIAGESTTFEFTLKKL